MVGRAGSTCGRFGTGTFFPAAGFAAAVVVVMVGVMVAGGIGVGGGCAGRAMLMRWPGSRPCVVAGRDVARPSRFGGGTRGAVQNKAL